MEIVKVKKFKFKGTGVSVGPNYKVKPSVSKGPTKINIKVKHTKRRPTISNHLTR